MPIRVSPERFDELVDRAIDTIPDELAGHVQNLVLLVADMPPPDQPRSLLGLYEGYALTERNDMVGGHLPDRITIFRWPLMAVCSTEEQLVEQVRITVLHEVAHYFGIDHDTMEELGYA